MLCFVVMTCSEVTYTLSSNADPLLKTVLKIPYVYLRMCSCESPDIQKCELYYTGMCWTSVDTLTCKHTEWFTFWVLHPGSEIRPSWPVIWVWRSSMRQRGDCWSLTIAGFIDAQWDRQRERLISLVVSDCFCDTDKDLTCTPAWSLTCFSQSLHSHQFKLQI